jgi:phage repressor protein C with HTH and peptisase S24 domain
MDLPHGQVPVFRDGKYVWVDVRVLDFRDGKYIVEMLDDHKIKQV